MEHIVAHTKESQTLQPSALKQELGLSNVISEKTSQLGTSQSEVLREKIASLDVSPEETEQAMRDLADLQQKESALLEEWSTGTEAVEQSDFDAIKESWRLAAEEQFGITDFKLEQFRRTLFNDAAMQQAFASGKEWNDVFDDMGKYVSGESYDMATKAFEAMGELEEEKPGSVKILHEQFGISSFHRYPKQILLQQLEPQDPSKEVGLLLFGENDWNGAFDNQQKVWNRIYNRQKDRLNFQIIECGSESALNEKLQKVQQEYAGRVALTVLSSHSEPEGFFLGTEGEEGAFVSQESVQKMTSSIKSMFAENAQFIANACSSGAISGWVKSVSKEARLKAVGPDRPAAIEDIDMIGNELVPKYYDGDIYSGYQNGFLLSKQKKRSTT